MISGFSCQSSILTHIFLKVPNPAKILPPIHVLYLRSGGAKILIFMSLTARRLTSVKRRSPKPVDFGKYVSVSTCYFLFITEKSTSIPLVSVDPPDNTIFPKRDLRRSKSVRLIASTTIWWIPGYSRPMISGSKRISGARKRSEPNYKNVSHGISAPTSYTGKKRE